MHSPVSDYYAITSSPIFADLSKPVGPGCYGPYQPLRYTLP
jgi:hypothetical protein